MKNFKAQDNFGFKISGDQDQRIPGIDSFYLQAIENADGVPYQLILLPQAEEGYFLKAGVGIQQLLGIATENFTDRLFLGMIEAVVPLSEDTPANMAECRQKIIRGEIRSCKMEILVRTADGKRKWIRDSSLPLVDDVTGKVTGAFGILYDITGSKLNSDRLNMIREKENECDSLKAAFLHNISHEIRTPLNAIVGFSTLLGEHPDGPDRRQEYLDTITGNADHLLEVIDDILEMAKIEARTIRFSRSRVNLFSIILRVYDQFKYEACRKGIILKYVVPSGDREAEIITDSYKLTKALSNLVGNSLKFTGEGRVEFGYSRLEKKIEFFISDTGIGIPEEQQASVFSRFYQADNSSKRSYGGTGLGLAIAKAYIELLRGEIWFTSAAGQGSVFKFTLPDERGGLGLVL